MAICERTWSSKQVNKAFQNGYNWMKKVMKRKLTYSNAKYYEEFLVQYILSQWFI